MEFENTGIVGALVIWGICNVFLLLVLLSAAIQRRTLDLIRGGLFLKVLATTIAINFSAYSTYYGVPHMSIIDPTIVLIISTIGAVGALMICRGLLR